MDYNIESLRLHEVWRGKIDYAPKMRITNREELSLAYTPGVAAPCLEIKDNPARSYDLTNRANLVAVITDGTAVLGLGDIGPEAAMPVMEGKCALFKTFGGVDAVPLCVRTTDVDGFVNTVALLAGSFGGINLEDISAPRCFEIEQKLKKRCDIPIFHDDQHGTAIVVAAAMLGALKLTGRTAETARVVVSGAGAAGIAIVKLLQMLGFSDIILCDTQGVIHSGRAGLNSFKSGIAQTTNPRGVNGGLSDALLGADAFIGVSAPGILSPEMVRGMSADAILFPMSNPVPEIMPDLAASAGAAIIGTGRSDFPNQINNVLAFPGVFRGAFDVRAQDINDAMKLAAAQALFALAADNLSPDYIIPEPFDARVVPAVADAVARAARETGVARI